MPQRDRLTAIVLIAIAVASWFVVAVMVTTVSPTGRPEVQIAGAILIGVACGVSTVPLAWLAVFSRRRRVARPGDWARAVRRGAWVWLVVTMLVALRTQHAFSPPIALFVIVMAAFVEVSLSIQR